MASKLFWPFLVRFGLNLGLNNLKFNQEAIFAVDSIESIQSSRSDRVDPIESIQSSRFHWKWLPGQILSCLDLNLVQIGSKMAIFGLNLDSNRSDRVGPIKSIRSSRSDRVDPIESIRLEMASWSNFKLFRPKFGPNRSKNGHLIAS